jgi:hypothetical protein
LQGLLAALLAAQSADQMLGLDEAGQNGTASTAKTGQ